MEAPTKQQHAQEVLALLQEDFRDYRAEGDVAVQSWADVLDATDDDIAQQYVLDAAVQAFGYETTLTLLRSDHVDDYVDDVLQMVNERLAASPLYAPHD